MNKKLSKGTAIKLYFPQLDSIRGISFIAIFLFHAIRISTNDLFPKNFLLYLYQNLPLGLEVFFVLSSFLLTYLGLNEYKKQNNFSFRNYFIRRALRIWPLYYFILLLAFIIFPVLATQFGFKFTLPYWSYYVFFIANFYTLDHVFFLRFLWTISVEEQFYLLWGLTLKFLHKRLLLVISFLFLISIFWSVYAIVSAISSYYNTLTYLFDFGVGALAAISIFLNNRIVNRVKNLSKAQTLIFYSYLIFHFIIFYFLNRITVGFANDFAALLSRYLFIIYIALFIIEQMVNCSRSVILENNKFFIMTGKLSYGLYSYHGITITFINLLLDHFGVYIANSILVLIYFVINYLIAIVSYKYLEIPFLKFKNRLRRI